MWTKLELKSLLVIHYQVTDCPKTLLLNMANTYVTVPEGLFSLDGLVPSLPWGCSQAVGQGCSLWGLHWDWRIPSKFSHVAAGRTLHFPATQTPLQGWAWLGFPQREQSKRRTVIQFAWEWESTLNGSHSDSSNLISDVTSYLFSRDLLVTQTHPSTVRGDQHKGPSQRMAIPQQPEKRLSHML